jgi:hypothetical protein
MVFISKEKISSSVSWVLLAAKSFLSKLTGTLRFWILVYWWLRFTLLAVKTQEAFVAHHPLVISSEVNWDAIENDLLDSPQTGEAFRFYQWYLALDDLLFGKYKKLSSSPRSRTYIKYKAMLLKWLLG